MWTFAPLALISTTVQSLARVVGKGASFVVDANTGQILHADRAEKLRYPASLTKMMTLYMVFERLQDGRLTYRSKITASPRAAARPPSKIGLKVGEQITVLQAIKALVTKSANDVATAVAEHIGGSEPDFARLMTNKARLLGMKNTVFRNASGLPDREQFTTARDMAKLAMRLQDHFPKYFRHFQTRSFRYKKRTYRNHNVLLGRYRGVNGIKTGYTRASGFNLVTSLQHDRRHVVAVVMGGKTGRIRNAQMRRLLSQHVKTASRRRTRKPNVRIALRARPRPAVRRAPAIRRGVAPARTWQTATSARRTSTQRASAPRQAAAPRQPGYKLKVAKVRSIDVRTRSSALNQSPPPIQQSNTVPTSAPTALHNYMIGKIAEPSLLSAPRRITRRSVEFGTPPPRNIIRSDIENRARQLRPTTFGSQPYQIQVGAYVTAEDASRQLANVRQRASGILSGAQPLTVPVSRGSRQMYRARFAGFDSRSAQATCNAMQKLAINCFVARAR